MQTDQLIDMYFNFTCSWTWYLALIYIKPVEVLEIVVWFWWTKRWGFNVYKVSALVQDENYRPRVQLLGFLLAQQILTMISNCLNISYSCLVCLIQYTVQYKMGLYWRITFTNNKYVLYLFILYCYKLIQSQKYITYYHILSIWWSGMSTRMNNFSCRL